MNLTDEQHAILAYIKGGKGDLLVEALAGSGKTFVLIEGLSIIPQRTVQLTAFNKRIADELVTRLPKRSGYVFHAKTFHSIGLKAVTSYCGKRQLEIKPEATECLINFASDELFKERTKIEGERKVSWQTRRAAVKLLRTLKETRIEKKLSPTAISIVGFEYEYLGKLNDLETKDAIEITRRAYEAGLDLDHRSVIDFCDMVWLPVVLDLPLPARYQAVFVDEAQDLSMLQFELCKKMLAIGGRMIVVGDLNQQIYGWRGADGDRIWREMKDATKLPLTTTFRCSRAVVAEAQELVPALQHRPDAPEGSVSEIGFADLAPTLKAMGDVSTFVLSRNNADLLQTALGLMTAGIEFQFTAGQEIFEPLTELIEKLDKTTVPRFQSSLATWFANETARAQAANATSWADRVEQQYAMLMAMMSYAEPREFKRVLSDLLGNTTSSIVLSSVHKIKGLEADYVFLLRETFARHKPPLFPGADKKEPDSEELHLEYVAVTRAKHHLIWVSMPDGVDVLTRILKLQTRDDIAKGGTIGKLAKDAVDRRAVWSREAIGRCRTHDRALRLTTSKTQRVCTADDCNYYEKLVDGCWTTIVDPLKNLEADLARGSRSVRGENDSEPAED